MTRLKIRFMLLMVRYAVYAMGRNGEGTVLGFGQEQTPHFMLFRQLVDLERDLALVLETHED